MAKRVAAVVFVVAGLQLVGVAQRPSPKIAERDQLVVTVWGVEQWSRTYPVAPDGTIDFPQLGKIAVVGRTAREVEADLAQQLKAGEYLLDPQVTIDLVQTANKEVTVSGSVINPGSYTYAGEWTVFDALVRAGQATVAAGERILVLRTRRGPGSVDEASPAQEEVITVSLVSLQRGDLSDNPVLLDGDVVVVPRAEQVFITGYVGAPGSYTVRTGMTVEQALALAGGISERGSSRRIEITRMVDGEREVLKGVKLDDPVKPGDTIKVNRSIM
jgi:polysaccharide export outer membrane protein